MLSRNEQSGYSRQPPLTLDALAENKHSIEIPGDGDFHRGKVAMWAA